MAETAVTNTGQPTTLIAGLPGIAADWSSDQRAFKNVSWGKAMMWIFLLSDTFIFSCFLLSYMTARMSTTVPWPNPSEVFALNLGGRHIPLILIAIMTFILISSSGTMAMAVNFGYRRDRIKTAALMLATAAFGATFVGMQAFEWTKLIMEGVRPWGNPWGAAQFGSCFFLITGFHGTHVSIGVIFLIAIMTFILISSSGTMAMAVNFGYRHDRVRTAALMLATAAFGATFVSMQGFEWTKLIMEGVRPWGNPWGAAQFGSCFFLITGFHGTHVTIGVIFLIAIARKVLRGDFDVERRGFFTSRKGHYEIVEITGLYWHFVDLVWVFIFAFFYLW